MSAFSGLPLVIEPADLATRLQAPELILVDLSPAPAGSTASAPSEPRRRPPAYCRRSPSWKRCSAN